MIKRTETFIGACSKYIDKQGWTTKIPISQIEEKGYRKINSDDIVISKKDYDKLLDVRSDIILRDMDKIFNQELAEMQMTLLKKVRSFEKSIERRTAREIWDSCIDKIMRGCGDDKEFWVIKILIETFKKYGVDLGE